MTFAELQRAVFDDMQYQPVPKLGVQDRIRRWLNEGLERVLRRPRLKNLRLGQWVFGSTAGRGFYGLPRIFERIDYLVDTTNGRRLNFRTRDWYRAVDPLPQSSGTPDVWIPEGLVPMRRLPGPLAPPDDNTVRLFVRSDFAGDTAPTGVHARLHFGLEVESTCLLDGTTPVLLFENASHWPIEITTLALTATCTGYIYITDHDGPDYSADPIAVIEPGELTCHHVGVRLYPTPSAAITYQVEGQRVIEKMKYDWDEPPWPADFHEMLACYARARFYRKDGRLAQSQAEMAEFERFALDLTAAIEYPVSYKPVAGKLSPGTHGWSDLGPWYPADRGN